MPFTAPKPISPAPDDLRGAKVLVVDDERSWRVILETDLRMIGYKVSMAEDADQALERAGAESPEVAILMARRVGPLVKEWGSTGIKPASFSEAVRELVKLIDRELAEVASRD